MRKTLGLGFARLLVIFLCLVAVVNVGGADAPATGKVDRVLGSEQSWQIIPAAYVLAESGSEVTLSGPVGQYLVVESKESWGPSAEVIVAFRLKPATGATTSVNVQMACGVRADKSAQALSFSAANAQGVGYLSYAASVAGGKAPPALSGVLHFQAVSDRSLAWSEEMRQAIEAQTAAAPKIEETLMTIRLTSEPGRMKAWLNGRFVAERQLEADFDTKGTVRITAGPGSVLVNVQVKPLAAVAPRFEPISLAGHANSSTLNGVKVDTTSVDPASKALDGVPFELVTANAWRGDHLDVGQSWTRFGAIPGYIAGNFGSFGGRWISADRVDPARLCLYIPRGRYQALHLLAVAEDRKDSVPVVGAQFYRPDAGHPINFSATVPSSKSGDKSKAVPIKLANGKKGTLYHVTIALDPDAFSWFTDLERIGLEITKDIRYYRAYPDPLEYSYHGGGLPSSVQIYAMTLERAGVEIDIVPENPGHVWTAPAAPKYSLDLRNATGAEQKATLVIASNSEDGKDATSQETQVTLPADGATVKVPVTLKPTRHGFHDMTVTLSAGKERATYKRNFAYLHENTRANIRWEHGQGAIFGYWGWNGGHVTPKADVEIPVMAAAGAETSTANYSLSPPEIQALAIKHHFVSEAAFFAGVMYYNGFYSWYSGAPKFNPADPEGSGKALIEAMIKGGKAEPGPISRPTFVPFFAEPHMGNITVGVWPSYYGEDYTLSPAEQTIFDDMKAKYMAGAGAIRKQWPELKLLLPYGDPMNAAIFLRLAPETRALIDGCALDLPGFERLPEQQINQVVLNRMYPIFKDIKQYVKDPYFTLIEGTCISSKDLDTGMQEQADIGIRDFLVLMGYGVTVFESGNAPFDCANYWGENHYGGGWLGRLPLGMPKPAYVHYATLTRNLNRANFTKYVPTGSTSTFCQQYQHYKTSKLIHVLWTIRGQRPVKIQVPAGTTLELYDPNDNVTVLKESNGVISFNVDQSPVYLHGLNGDAAITLGASDHSDAQPGKESRKLTNLSDGWSVVKKEDLEYTKNKPLQIERFLADMTGRRVDAPAAQGKKALAIHLEKQAKDRGVMPYYTTLEPKKALEIPGKASHLGLWVHAASDWGRVVYSLRDAKGEKWISVGTKEDWNNDDIHGWSHFCFDGWRYLTFQLPSSLPYDSYREHGTSWWGTYGGDGIVDLPLKLEKIIVERRNKAIYGNDLVEVKADDVLLGDLYAEYASADDRKDEVIRLSRLRMPVTKDAPAIGNPIAELAQSGVGAPTKVLRVADPDHGYDGTRCHLHFEAVAGAKSYDVWVSPYADGRGAMQLGKAWKESGQLIQGLRPDIAFYAFVVYTDQNDKLSKPSQPLRFVLKDRFGYK